MKRYGAEGRRMNEALADFEPSDRAAKQWALNDEGTSLFIMGTVYAQLDRYAEAAEAFEALLKHYRYAQCWDPKGWYWHPVTGARDKVIAYRRLAGEYPSEATLPLEPAEAGATASSSQNAPAASRQDDKRGVAYHFCGWPFSRGQADLRAMVPGLAWYDNWSSRPLTRADGRGVGKSPLLSGGTVEFVPMAWGLVDDGKACATAGACFRVDHRQGGAACQAACAGAGEEGCYDCRHQGLSREAFLKDLPAGSRYLLGFNEPNFKERANPPEAAAKAWQHVEWVADRRKLKLVGPATNFCDPTPGANHPGACIEAVNGDAMMGLAWLERFYDPCSEDGVAGHDCRMEYQAVHAYACFGVSWMIDLMKTKAGLVEPSEAHCRNGVQDADEFGPDCGGNACTACTAHARKLFRRPVWLTEFAAPKDDCKTEDPQVLVQRAQGLMAKDLPKFSADPYVFRYAWFMPKVTMPSLDHGDLLVQDAAGVLSPLGRSYFGLPPARP